MLGAYLLFVTRLEPPALVSHQVEYHSVWVTKYRFKVLEGEVAERVRELVRQTCETFEISVVQGIASKDHAYILASCPPEMAPSEIMLRIKDELRVIWLKNFLTRRGNIGEDIFARQQIR